MAMSFVTNQQSQVDYGREPVLTLVSSAEDLASEGDVGFIQEVSSCASLLLAACICAP